uniref:Replication protein A subunit n=1 Tax=Strongyloides papillosus TaxID=174720 RepID=A0A0N5BWH9_STREA
MPSDTHQEYELSRGFFQLLAENKVDGLKPVVQIMNSRLTNDGSSIRLRLNDGIFSYATILLKDNSIAKFGSYGMDKSQSIIKILEFCSNTTLKENVKRMHLTINDFELVAKDSPIIGSPIPHSGSPEEHLGLKIDKIGQGPSEESNSQFPPEVVRNVVKEVKNESSEYDASVVPIISISPYLMQWKIRGVVTDRSQPRDINTPRGASKVFNFSITDKEGTEIRISCFGDMVAQLDSLIEVGSSYAIKGNNKAIKTTNKRYNSTGHEYEITMRNDVEIIKCEDSVPLPARKINRVFLSKIKMFPGESVDVVAVVDSMEEATNVSTKNGITKRMNISLIDESASLVKLTIWGNSCNEFTEDYLHKPIILKSVAVNEFNGVCSLQFGFRSKVVPSDGAGLVQDISDWYARERGNIQVSSIRPPGTTFGKNLTIHSATVNFLNDKDKKGGFFNVIGRVARVRENLVYTACSQKNCKKKVVAQDGQYHCSKCDLTSDNFKYALMVVFEIYDHSGSHWLTMFDSSAEKLLKKTASEIGAIIEAHGESDGHNMVVSSIINTIHNFNVRCKVETHNEVPIDRWVGTDVRPVNLTKYVEHLQEMCKDAEEICSKRGM